MTGDTPTNTPELLRFVYRNARNEVKTVSLIGWQERGYYLQGRCMEDGRWKTYRIDRVAQYLNDGDRLLQQPYQQPPPVLTKRSAPCAASTGNGKAKGMQICFTGFEQQRKVQLTAIAHEAGLHVVQSVTVNLRFLVGGANAGPKKTEDARARGIYIINEDQFLDFAETGELPDEQDHRFGSRFRAKQIDPKDYFKHWHYAIYPHHWSALGVAQRMFTRTRPDGIAEQYLAWAIESVSGYSFAAGDMFYPTGTDRQEYLQVVYNTEDGDVEVHHGHFDKLFLRKGYLATYEQLAFWLETGNKPTTLREVFRGNSRGGLFGWQLGDGESS